MCSATHLRVSQIRHTHTNGHMLLYEEMYYIFCQNTLNTLLPEGENFPAHTSYKHTLLKAISSREPDTHSHTSHPPTDNRATHTPTKPRPPTPLDMGEGSPCKPQLTRAPHYVQWYGCIPCMCMYILELVCLLIARTLYIKYQSQCDAHRIHAYICIIYTQSTVGIMYYIQEKPLHKRPLTDYSNSGGRTIIPSLVVRKTLVQSIVHCRVCRTYRQCVSRGIGEADTVVVPHPFADHCVVGTTDYGGWVSKHWIIQW